MKNIEQDLPSSHKMDSYIALANMNERWLLSHWQIGKMHAQVLADKARASSQLQARGAEIYCALKAVQIAVRPALNRHELDIKMRLLAAYLTSPTDASIGNMIVMFEAAIRSDMVFLGIDPAEPYLF